MATCRPIEFLDADSLGANSVGGRAAMVLLSADPRADIRYPREIKGVIAGGRYFDCRELDELLERAAGREDAHRIPFLAAKSCARGGNEDACVDDFR